MASVLSRIQIIMEANTANYNNEMRRARENSNTTFGEIGKSATKAALVVGAALAGMGAVSVKTAMSFETAMAEVNKTVDFTANYSLPDLKKELEDLTKVMPLTFEELAKIAAAGGQSGVAAEGLKEFTETIAKMSIAFDISADETADAMAKISSSYNVPIENVKDLGDAINEVSNSGAVKANQIVDFMLRVGQSASNLNIAGEAAAALGGALIDAGGSVEVVGTAMKSIFTDMSSTEWLDSMSIILTDLGIDVKEYAKVVKTDGLAAFMMIREGIMSAENPVETLNTLFDAAGGNAASLFSEGSKVEAMLGSVGQVAGEAATHIGSLDKEYQAMADTAANGFVLLQNSASLISAAAGEAFLPAVRQMTDAIIPLVQKAAEWAKANPELIRQITLIGGSLLGTIVGLKLAVDGFTAAKDTIDGLKTAFTVMGPVVKAAFTLLTGGIGLPLVAIAALIAAAVLLYQNWDYVKEKAGELNEYIKSVFGSLPEPLQQAGRDIAEIFKFIWNTGKEYLTLISELYSGTFESFKTIATGAFQVVWSVIKVSFSGILNTVSSALQIVATVFSTGFALVKNTVTTVLGVIKAVITGDFKAIPGIIGNGLKSAASIVGSMMTNILNIIKNYGKKLFSIGKDFIQGFINGIKSVGSGVASAASTMVGNAVAAVKKRQDSASPSKVTTKLGGDFAQGMADGIKKGKKAVVTEAQKMAADAVKAVKDGILNLQKELALFGNNSKVAELEFDIAAGKFPGVPQADLDEYKRLTQIIELKKELASANDSVQSSIDAMVKKRVLFNNASEVASLEYDILYTDRFKNASGERVQLLLNETKAVEGLAKQLAATNAIKERFAQLEKDRESSKKAMAGVMTELVNESPLAKIQADYDRRIEISKTNEMLETGIIGSAEAERLAIEQSYQDAKRNLMLTQGEALFGDLSGLAKSFAGEQSGIYRALFAVEKGFAIAQSAMAIQQSVAKAMAVGFPQNIPIIGQAVMQGAELVSNIKSIAMPVGQAHDGLDYVPKEGTWMLDEGERVVKPADNRKLTQFLDSGASKGGDVHVNVHVTMDGNSNVESNSQYGKQIGQGLAAVVVSEVTKMTKPNGTLDRLYAKR